MLFIRPDHLRSLTDTILQEARKSSWLLFNFAWRHKLAGILEGYMTKQSLWDRLVFDSARVKVMGKGAGTVRTVLVGGGTPFACPSCALSRSHGAHAIRHQLPCIIRKVSEVEGVVDDARR